MGKRTVYSSELATRKMPSERSSQRRRSNEKSLGEDRLEEVGVSGMKSSLL